MTQDKIYQYFERDPQLRVLFIFNNDWIAAELENATWAEGYRYVDFKGDWFTVKYNLDNDWQLDNIFKQIAECREYHDRLHVIADKQIAFDLGEGVVVN